MFRLPTAVCVLALVTSVLSVSVAQSSFSPPESGIWYEGFHRDGVRGQGVFAMTHDRTGRLIIGGAFDGAGADRVQNIAVRDGGRWLGLAAGLDGPVDVLAIAPEGDLIAGGAFRRSGSVEVPFLARWNGSTWKGFGDGPPGPVTAVAFGPDGRLYAGGLQRSASHRGWVATWDGTGWQILSTDFVGKLSVWVSQFVAAGSIISSLAVDSQGRLYVGGAFESTLAEPRTNSLLRFDGETWSRLPVTAEYVAHLSVDEQDRMLVAGHFRWGNLEPKFMQFSDNRWSPMAPDDEILAPSAVLPNSDGSMHVVALRRTAHLQYIRSLMHWDGAEWTTLGDLYGGGSFPSLQLRHGLAADPDGSLLLGGPFVQVNDVHAQGLIRWINDEGFLRVDPGHGTTGPLFGVIGSGDNVFVLGRFHEAGDAALYRGRSFGCYVDCTVAARWDGVSWTAPPVGSPHPPVIRTAVSDGQGGAYLGGNYQHVIHWKDDHVRSLPAEGLVLKLAHGLDGRLYGAFGLGGGMIAYSRWNGSEWTELGRRVGDLYAMVADAAGNLFVSGHFRERPLERWTVGMFDHSGWRGLRMGLEYVPSLAVTPSGLLFAGGTAAEGGGTVGMWDGIEWTYLPDSPGGIVRSLAVSAGGGLYAGGSTEISEAGAETEAGAATLARWDGASWTRFDDLVAGKQISALAPNPDGSLWVAGVFSEVNGVPASNLARWLPADDGPAIPPITYDRRAVLFPNPATNHATLRLVPEASGLTSITLYDVLGRRMDTVFDGHLESGGAQWFRIDTSRYPSGQYMVRIMSETFRETRSLIIVR